MHETIPTVRIKATDPEQGEFIVINESDFDPTKHERVGIAPPPPPPFEPAPLPAPVDTLASLQADWRNRDDLRDVALAVGGRSVENTKQAIEVIEAALAAAKK